MPQRPRSPLPSFSFVLKVSIPGDPSLFTPQDFNPFAMRREIRLDLPRLPPQLADNDPLVRTINGHFIGDLAYEARYSDREDVDNADEEMTSHAGAGFESAHRGAGLDTARSHPLGSHPFARLIRSRKATLNPSTSPLKKAWKALLAMLKAFRAMLIKAWRRVTKVIRRIV